jgi:hypothetical protein
MVTNFVFFYIVVLSFLFLSFNYIFQLYLMELSLKMIKLEPNQKYENINK